MAGKVLGITSLPYLVHEKYHTFENDGVYID